MENTAKALALFQQANHHPRPRVVWHVATTPICPVCKAPLSRLVRPSHHHGNPVDVDLLQCPDCGHLEVASVRSV